MSLTDYLPWRIYHGEPHVAEFQKAVEAELHLLQETRDDLYRQLRLHTSTWGLACYEREFAIQPNDTRDRGLRMAGWRARRRGRSTTTEALIRSVAESYTDDPVEIRVYPREYSLEVRLPDIGAMPDYLEDMMAVVWEIRPAHLGMAYRIPLNTTDAIHTAQVCHRRGRGSHPLRFPKIEGNVQVNLFTVSAPHGHICATAPLTLFRKETVPVTILQTVTSEHRYILQDSSPDYMKVPVSAAALPVAAAAHLHIRRQTGGIEHAPYDE